MPRAWSTLYAAVRAADSEPFIWGDTDCGLWVAKMVELLTGRDPAAHIRGTYDDEAGAQAVIAEHGGLEGLVTSCLGRGPIENPLYARRGDVVLIDVPEHGRLIGMCLGADCVWKAPDGVGRLPLNGYVRKAWRV